MGLKSLPEKPEYDIIVGTPEHCIERLAAVKKHYSPDEIILLQGFRGISNESLINSIRRSGDLVLPALA